MSNKGKAPHVVMSIKYLDRITKELDRSFLFGKPWMVLVVAITVLGLNYSYSVTMMCLTTFVLAYMSKGSRRK